MRKPVLVLALIAVLFTGGVLGYSLWKGRTPEGFYEAGKKYYDSKKYPEAVISFLNAVQKDARHRDARYYLALSYLNQRDGAHALEQLTKILEYYPDDIDASLQLGRVYLAAAAAQHDPEFSHQAQALAEKILSRHPQNVEALILSANASLALQDLNSSIDLLEKAVNLDPKNTAALISLGTSFALQKNYPEAERELLKASEANPEDKGVLVALGNYYRSVGEPDKLETVLKDAISKYPSEPAIYSQLVDFYTRNGRYDEAQKVLREAQAADATNPAPTIVLANFLQATNHPADARKLLVESKPKFPKNFDLAAALVANLIPDKPEQAKRELEELVKMDPKNRVGSVLVGELQFRMGELDAAEVSLAKETVVNSRFPQIHFILGKIAASKGHVDQAQDHYQKSLAVNASYVPARYALAETYLAKGRTDSARVELRQVLQLQPGNVEAHILNTELDIQEKKWKDAEEELSTLIKAQPDNPAILRQIGVLNDLFGKTAEAEKDYLRALQLAPTERSFRDVTSFYLRSKRPDRAIQTLSSVSDSQKQAFHYELLGTVAAATSKLQDAENDYKKALAKDPSRTNTEMLLLNLYVQTGRLDEGMKLLDDLEKKDPKSSAVHAMKGNIFQAQGKVKEATENYALALQGDSNNDLAANNLAYILAEEGRDLQTALQYAQGARKRQPQDPSVADTLGWVYYKLGNVALAKEEAEFATSKVPDDGLFQYHLGTIYGAAHDRTRAEIALKRAVASKNSFKEKPLAEAALKEMDRVRQLLKP